jgi:hypothetical protein
METKWFQSNLLSEDPVTVKHQFSCPKCGSLLATQSDVSGSNLRPWTFVRQSMRRLRRLWHLLSRETFRQYPRAAALHQSFQPNAGDA